jgi:hypothetical protein
MGMCEWVAKVRTFMDRAAVPEHFPKHPSFQPLPFNGPSGPEYLHTPELPEGTAAIKRPHVAVPDAV